MIRLRRVLLLALVLLVAAVGCERKKGETSAADASMETTEEPTGPQRIVSLAPSVTETLYALGAGDRIVGVTRFCDYPPEAAKKPKVGGLTDTDVEAIVGLEPDLVVGVATQTAKPLRRTLEKAEVPTLFLPVETFDEVTTGIGELGKRVGAPERAAELVAAIDEVQREPSAESPTVLVLFGREPWIAAGPGTFAHEMVRRAGGKNALADASKAYVTLDVERLRATDADLVLDTTMGNDDATEPPVPGARVATIDPALMRPGPRLADAMKTFAREIEASSGGEPQ